MKSHTGFSLQHLQCESVRIQQKIQWAQKLHSKCVTFFAIQTEIWKRLSKELAGEDSELPPNNKKAYLSVNGSQ